MSITGVSSPKLVILLIRPTSIAINKSSIFHGPSFSYDFTKIGKLSKVDLCNYRKYLAVHMDLSLSEKLCSFMIEHGSQFRAFTNIIFWAISYLNECLTKHSCSLQESINGSLLNLLTYPWIEKRVSEGTLSLHGGYYDFIDCTFEKWTLVYREGLEGGSKYAIKNRALWS